MRRRPLTRRVGCLAGTLRVERELDVTFEESQAALAALAAMTGSTWRSAAAALPELVGGRRELRQRAEALVRRGTSG